MTRKGVDTQELLSFESCRSSVVDDMEEVSLESSRKMQDKEETTLEASWAAVPGRKEKEGWRLEPKGRNGDASSHSFAERGGRRPCEP